MGGQNEGLTLQMRVTWHVWVRCRRGDILILICWIGNGHIQSERPLPTSQAGWHRHHVVDMNAAINRGGHFMLGPLPVKRFCFTLILWCLVLATSSLVFQSVTGSTTLLPYFIGGGLVIKILLWPWTFVVISGVMFTIKVACGKSNGEFFLIYSFSNSWIDSSY